MVLKNRLLYHIRHLRGQTRSSSKVVAGLQFLVSMAPAHFAGLFPDARLGSLSLPFIVSIQAGPFLTKGQNGKLVMLPAAYSPCTRELPRNAVFKRPFQPCAREKFSRQKQIKLSSSSRFWKAGKIERRKIAFAYR